MMRVILPVFGVLLALISISKVAEAQPIEVDKNNMHTMTISELVFRIDEDADIGVAKDGVKVEILEELRKYGFNALGAENLVFGEDKSAEARFILGGTVKELECTLWGNACRILVTWELFDQAKNGVVYKVDTRGLQKEINASNRTTKLKQLIKDSVKSMLGREMFVKILTKGGDGETEDFVAAKKEYETATFKRCEEQTFKMPKQAKSVLGATVLVESKDGFGSGVVISPDGYILTAAHVVASGVTKIIFQGGREATAELIRFDDTRDVALLKMAGSGFDCLSMASGPSSMGDKVFAIGSPASTELSFSLTGGIVSALREWQEAKFLQTDASINPGNSGGPMLDENGKIIAIVSWKLAGIGVEGVGFGIPIDTALETLALKPGGETDDSIKQPGSEEKPVDSDVQAFVDKADPYESLDIEAEIKRARLEQAPAFYRISKYSGVLLLVGGGVTVGFTYMFAKLFADDMTYDEFNRRKIFNTIGWITAGVGAALYTTSFFLLPSKKKIRKQLEQEQAPKAEVDFRLLPGSANLEVRF